MWWRWWIWKFCTWLCTLQKKNINVFIYKISNETEIICHDNNPIAPVYYLLIKDYTLIDKEWKKNFNILFMKIIRAFCQGK